MADLELTVELDGSRIGTLLRSDSKTSLTYNDEYRSSPSRTPLSVSMPRTFQSHGEPTTEAWLWGLLPDNDDVLRRWARDFEASLSSATSYLSTEIGLDCAGAVRFYEASDESSGTRDSGVTWLASDEMVQRVGELISDSTSWQTNSGTGQFSLAGAQAKTALRFDADSNTWGIPYGNEASTHIIKPALPGFEDQDVNEHLCLSAARLVGLVAAETDAKTFGEHRALVVTRFDRHQTSDGAWHRIHQEDMCQALGIPPSRKYQSDGGPSAVDIVQLIHRVVEPSVAQRETWRLIDALIFNWIVAGTDAHAKNFGLLHSGAQTRLTPLYDVSSFLPYDDSKGHKLKLAMKIGGEYKIKKIGRKQWEQFASATGSDALATLERCEQIATGVPDAFVRAASELTFTSEIVERLVDQIAIASTDRLNSLAGHMIPVPEMATFAIQLTDEIPFDERPEADVLSVRMRLLVKPPGESDFFYYQFIVARWPRMVVEAIDGYDSLRFWDRLGAAAVAAAQTWLNDGASRPTTNPIDARQLLMSEVSDDHLLLLSDLDLEKGAIVTTWTGPANAVRRPASQMRAVGDLQRPA